MCEFSKTSHLQSIRYISDADLCTVKIELSWVLLGGKKSSVHVQSNRISTGVKTLNLETFWNIDGYGTVKKPHRILMTKDKKSKRQRTKNKLMKFWEKYLFQERAL